MDSRIIMSSGIVSLSYMVVATYAKMHEVERASEVDTLLSSLDYSGQDIGPHYTRQNNTRAVAPPIDSVEVSIVGREKVIEGYRRVDDDV
jgi:hypothetical protein